MDLTEMKCTNCGAALEADSTKRNIICQYCGSKYINKNASEKNGDNIVEGAEEDVVFALWKPDGYYYPGEIIETYNDSVKVLFLDNDSAIVQKENVMEFKKALSTLKMEGNWKNGGYFYGGKISGSNPMIMN